MKNLLFIVEGDKTEIQLISHLSQIFQVNCKYDIYSYKTSIFEFYDDLAKDTDLDMIQLLKEKSNNDDERKRLNQKFTNVYLIFDLDPHYQKSDFAKLDEMLIRFNDSTNEGKLYINYPMIESYKHLLRMPDLDFLTRSVDQLQVTEYKEIVGSCTNYSNISSQKYITTRDIVIHHVTKLSFIITNKKTIDKELCYDINSSTSIALLNMQKDNYKKDKLYVINTAVLFLFDLLQSRFVNQVSNKIKFD